MYNGKNEIFNQTISEENTLYQEMNNKDSQSIYLRIRNKFAEKIDKFIKLIKGIFITIFIHTIISKEDEITTSRKKKFKIVKHDKNLFPLIENEINGKVHCICEIKEEENYIIFSQNDKLYKLSNGSNNPKVIADIKIYLILQVSRNTYIISNDNGTYIYEGSILEITRENLEIKEKKIEERIFNLGILINQSEVVLVNKDVLVIVNMNNKEIKSFQADKNYSDFCVNCHDLFNSKNNMNILLLICQKSKKKGILKIDFINGNFFDTFFEINDFDIHCFLRIEKNMVEAFSENFDEDYIYLLCGGKENKIKYKEKKIKLYKFQRDSKNKDEIKDIWVEKNNSSNFKSIIQYQYNSLIINDCDGNTIIFDIINMKNSEQNTVDFLKYENKSIIKILSDTNDKNKDSYKNIYQKLVKLEPIDNLIKIIYQLSNRYCIIAQNNKIFVKDESFSSVFNYDFDDSHYTYCICQKSETEIFICRSNGLYILNLKDKKDVRKDKINDMIYYLILKIKDNDYIVSLDKGTFRVKRDIPSINEEDLKDENMISNKTYKIGDLTQINNKNLVILMNNIKNEEGDLKVIVIDNIGNNYFPIKNNYPYVLLKNCTISFSLQAKEDPNNYIYLCATEKIKDYQKNGLLGININIHNKSILEDFYDLYNFKINSMTLYERQNNNNNKYFTHFLIGGNIYSNEFEIRLFKILFSNGKGKDCLSFEYIKRVVYYEDIQNYYSFMVQSIMDGQLIISSNIGFYLFIIRAYVKKIEEKKEIEKDEEWNENDSVYNRIYS